MVDLIVLFRRAVGEFGRRVDAVGDNQWSQPTPCSDWDVRALVNHLVYEHRWAIPLFEGATVAEVGDRFEGDLLGDDPKGAWTESSVASLGAVGHEGALTDTVHLSFGDVPGAEYLNQLITDHAVHAWDLARAIGTDEHLDPDLVEFAEAYLAPQVDAWRGAGAFGPAAEVAPDADRQSRLLALTGRRP